MICTGFDLPSFLWNDDSWFIPRRTYMRNQAFFSFKYRQRDTYGTWKKRKPMMWCDLSFSQDMGCFTRTSNFISKHVGVSWGFIHVSSMFHPCFIHVYIEGVFPDLSSDLTMVFQCCRTVGKWSSKLETLPKKMTELPWKIHELLSKGMMIDWSFSPNITDSQVSPWIYPLVNV